MSLIYLFVLCAFYLGLVLTFRQPVFSRSHKYWQRPSRPPGTRPKPPWPSVQ
ncbi:hypothetical protein BS50DRAFT_569833 [Corynespora cassiicola Philippines]|uniref:Uncharacterized protein n=1 Tax=Corynespora cassiicola Philippines TaxID=1448308 RepID=A0A2T2P4R9_CORCC|nr:hypothetical protein BS50DRAFT_569833 [Corynespora cassiicola Philippines]